MRKIKLTSVKNPEYDVIELNDFSGLLCTKFQSLGVSRTLEFLQIKNRNLAVKNTPNFRSYSLTIEILSPYSLYEKAYYDFLKFIDRNKKDGIRLYYQAYDNVPEKYCFCEIQQTDKTEKRQPIVLTLVQSSFWFGKAEARKTSQGVEKITNPFEFSKIEGMDYYAASFALDEDSSTNDFYAISFSNPVSQYADVTISGYNEVPIEFVISGKSINPIITIYEDGKIIRQVQINIVVDEGQKLQITAGIVNYGVWLIDSDGKCYDVSNNINHSLGSPYVFLDHGTYSVTVQGEGDGASSTIISWQEEYSE